MATHISASLLCFKEEVPIKDIFSSIKAVTLIFIHGRGSAVSSAKQWKSGSIYLVKN